MCASHLVELGDVERPIHPYSKGWWRPDNPAKGIERYKEQKRDRWLSDDELRRLCAVLNEHSNKRAAN
jgi:hypothetical protein